MGDYGIRAITEHLAQDCSRSRGSPAGLLNPAGGRGAPQFGPYSATQTECSNEDLSYGLVTEHGLAMSNLGRTLWVRA